jgi:fructosamine-3-kinase
VDLAYLRAHPQHLPTFLRHQRIRETPVAGHASRLTLDDGTSVFAKTWPSGRGPVPSGFFAAEAAGLRWLREAGAVPVPEVFSVFDDMLAMEWVEEGHPSPGAAEQLGRGLAGLHRAGAPEFGAGWPGFIGLLPMPNTPSAGPWHRWFAERRLAPYLQISTDRGALSTSDAALVERVLDRIGEYGGDEPPARVHGDLWPGNVRWSADGRAWLIDPAAHGGHRESDLALLGLFGAAPHVDRIVAAYQEAWPLADGWRVRVPLHQLHLLLVHTALFGAAYRDPVLGAVRELLRSG